jgi:hypothetical protein
MNSLLARMHASNEARFEKKVEAAKEAAVLRITPLEDRLKKVLSTIPIETQREGLSLTSLRILLRGRQGRNCHCGDLGEALRALNFQRRRSYASGENSGYSARWYPPS